MEEVTAEISGQVLAAFHHKFAESQADFLAILLGSVGVQNYTENTDLATKTEKRKVRVVVQDWTIASMQEVLDFKTGKFNKKLLESVGGGKLYLEFVGMLKFQKTKLVDLTPSFMDRKVMDAVLASCSWREPRSHLYLLVGEEMTTTLSIKYSMKTVLLEHMKDCLQGPWSRMIPLVVPNLGTYPRVEYKQAGGGGSKALEEMVEGTGLVESCMVDLDKTFQPLSARFKAGVELVHDRVTALEVEESKANLEEEVKMLKQRINDRLELSRGMKMVRGLQGNLNTALEVDWDDSEFPNMFEERMNRDTLNFELSEEEEE